MAIRSRNVGADLSEFQYQELELTDPQSIRIGHFKKMIALVEKRLLVAHQFELCVAHMVCVTIVTPLAIKICATKI
jgi:hypothetical protein